MSQGLYTLSGANGRPLVATNCATINALKLATPLRRPSIGVLSNSCVNRDTIIPKIPTYKEDLQKRIFTR